MSEQLKQELDATEIDRLETKTDVDSKTIGQDETELSEGKLEDESGNESKEDDIVPMGKASLADIVSGLSAPTEEEIKTAEAENTKSIKQKAKEKLEAEKQKATQKNFADPIITYLLKRCEEDQGLAEDVMQDCKTWNKCFDYIVDQARKVPRSGSGVAVEDHVVYEWAEDYYHKEEKPEPDKEAGASKPTKKKNAKATSKKQKGESEEVKEVTTSVPEPVPERKEAVKTEKKEKPKKKETAKKPDKPSMDGQMSLFDLL